MPRPTQDDVVTALAAMKERLVTRGWCQHYLWSDPADFRGQYADIPTPDSQACLYGAAYEATMPANVLQEFLMEESSGSPLTIGVLQALQRETKRRYRLEPPVWQDVAGRTLDEVLTLIDQTIATVKETYA